MQTLGKSLVALLIVSGGVLFFVFVVLDELSYVRVKVGSQSDLPDFTVVAKKSNCSTPPGQGTDCSSYQVKIVLNGRVNEFWFQRSQHACYSSSEKGQILKPLCREQLNAMP